MVERQQGEGESASETSENAGGVGGRGFLLSPHHFNMNQESDRDEEEEKFIFRPPGEFKCSERKSKVLSWGSGGCEVSRMKLV